MQRKTTASIVTVVLVLLTYCTEFAPAQTLGEEKWVDGPRYDVEAAWDEEVERDTPWQVDDAFHGWAIVEYRDEVESDRGVASHSIELYQPGGSYVSIQEIDAIYKSLVDLAAKKGLQDYAAKMSEEGQQHRQFVQRTASSHRAIVVHARARGSHNTFDRVGAAIKGKIKLKLHYVGTIEDLRLRQKRHLDAIQEISRPTALYRIKGDADVYWLDSRRVLHHVTSWEVADSLFRSRKVVEVAQFPSKQFGARLDGGSRLALADGRPELWLIYDGHRHWIRSHAAAERLGLHDPGNRTAVHVEPASAIDAIPQGDPIE
jgi:hypothetical protein